MSSSLTRLCCLLVRTNKDNPLAYNPVSQQMERAYGPTWKRVVKFIPSTLVMLVFIGLIVVAGVFAIWIKTLEGCVIQPT